MTNDLISVQELKFSKVVTPAHKEIGEVDDVIIHKKSKTVAYVVLKLRGLMGFGDKKFPIPFSAFYLDTKEKKKVILDVEKAKLENAPSFDLDDMSSFDYSDFLLKVYKYYDLEPYPNDLKDEDEIQLSGKLGTHPKTIKEARFKNSKFDNNHSKTSERHKSHYGL